MNRIIAFVVASLATISLMAQEASMNFIGGSDYTCTTMGMTISGNGVKDTVTVSDNNSSITFPDMNVMFMGTKMTVPAMKIVNLSYTKTGNPSQNDVIYTWDKAAADTIVNVYVEADKKYENKKLKITSLHASYSQATESFSVTFLFQYGNMPGVVTFSETGYYTPSNRWNLTGRGTASNPYHIFDADDFTAMAKNISNDNLGTGEHFQMMNDIDFGGTAESPVRLPSIGKDFITNITTVTNGFQGTFDGCSHTISGIYHNNSKDTNAEKFNALFSSLGEGGTVKNLIFSASNSISTYSYGAPFVSINKGGCIENCVNYANVTCESTFAGGICGYLVGGKGTVKNCTNNGEITAMTYPAGICCGTQSGSAIGTKDADYKDYVIDKCVNNGYISSTSGLGSAGIAGSFSGVITNCTNYGTIDDSKGTAAVKKYTAGIVSVMTYVGGASNNVNKGAVKGQTYVAGIIGIVYKGGNEKFSISGNTNEGTITAESYYGDIIGGTKRTLEDNETTIIPLGDLNYDFAVDVRDVNIAVALICGKAVNSTADINGDGKFDQQDIDAIVSIICQ